MEQSVQFNFIPRSDGSALYTLGGTVILASVTGPGPSRPMTRKHDKSVLDVTFLPCSGTPTVTEKSIESFISECIESLIISHLHPRTEIGLNIQEMQSQHQFQLISAALNASCLALLDSGLQLKGLLAAVCCCLTKQGVIIVEPSAIDVEESVCSMVFIFESASLELLATKQKGRVTVEEYNDCLRQCERAAQEILNFYRTKIEEQYSERCSIEPCDS